VLTLKLTAAQELRGAGCHGGAYELDAGAADPSHRGAGGEDGEVSGGWPPEGSGAAGAGAGGRQAGGAGARSLSPGPSLPSTSPWTRGGFLQPAVPPVSVCAALCVLWLVQLILTCAGSRA
jgi:hypothetical protein